jgi:hypothetical protein
MPLPPLTLNDFFYNKHTLFPKCEDDPRFRYQNYITWVPGKALPHIK